MDVQVEIKNQYGANVVHPVCDRAQLFADIAGTKTLSMAVWVFG